jgi:DNA-binding response OmpR family regulator
MRLRALLIESDAILLAQFDRKLRRNFDVTPVLTAQQAIDALDNEDDFDVVILDFDLGRNNGVELLHEIRSYDDWLELPVIMLSSIPKNRLPISKLAKYGVEQFLYKPQTAPHELLRQATRAIS